MLYWYIQSKSSIKLLTAWAKERCDNKRLRKLNQILTQNEFYFDRFY